MPLASGAGAGIYTSALLPVPLPPMLTTTTVTPTTTSPLVKRAVASIRLRTAFAVNPALSITDED